MLRKLLKYYYTLKDLKWIQIVYQIRERIYKAKYRPSTTFPRSRPLNLVVSPLSRQIMSVPQTFQFLNRIIQFKDKIEWGTMQEGLLWNYNLNYFDFLHQKELSFDIKLNLINDFVESDEVNHDPYPTSLRIINWIVFFSKNEGLEDAHEASLYSQLLHLSRRLEYRLLGNHLLENAFALLFGAYFFRSKHFFSKALRILEVEVDEQINADGGHFERSIMYHKIILLRFLQGVDLIRNNPSFEGEKVLLQKLEKTSSMMLGYLSAMTFEDGTSPHFNDSCDKIAPDSELLFSNAALLNIDRRLLPLGQTGFRKFKNSIFEGFINVASLKPAYIAGHAHSDIGHFILNFQHKPFIVDTGISTYENNAIRAKERATSSHNTVLINGINQSDVWSAFRVGRKASVNNLIEGVRKITVQHDGYKQFGSFHKRELTWENEAILIFDSVGEEIKARAHLHFHPNVRISEEAGVFTADDCYIDFEFADNVEILEYDYAYGFNKRVKAQKMRIDFTNKLLTKLSIK